MIGKNKKAITTSREKKILPYCESGKTQEHAAQRDCRIYIIKRYSKPNWKRGELPAVGDPAMSRELD